MKKRIDVFSDGSIAYSEQPQGYEVEINNTSLGNPVESFEPTDEQVELLKDGVEKVKFNTNKQKLEKK